MDKTSFYIAKPIYWLLLLVCTGLMASTGAQASVRAQLDRTTVNEGETFTLNITSSDGNKNQPDVSVLQKDFDVLGTGQKNMIQIINGSVQSQHSWTITLAPRHSGTLTIPPIAVGNDTTNPITLTVLPAGTAFNQGSSNSDVFLEVTAKPDQAYVQSELLYTVRLYYDTPLRQGTLSEPTLDNAIVQKLGKDSNFETQRGGQTYQVIERRYAIFPQRSGKLHIPSLVFDGAIDDPSARTGDPFFDSFNPATRHLHLRSRTLDIPIAAQPANYQGTNWLPAQDIHLTQTWSPQHPQFRVGEPVTRTLTIHAKGLSASQLPDLPLPDLNNVKLYPDQAQTKDNPAGDTLESSREQKIAMIPTQAGDLTLPAIHLQWWDTTTQSERVASLPAETVHVLPAAGNATSAVSNPPVAETTPATTTQSQSATTKPAAASVNTQSPILATATMPWLWIATTLLFALAWLVTLLLWWRRRPQRLQVMREMPTVDAQPEQNAVRQLHQACQKNDPQAVKQALLAWSRRLWPDTPPLSLGALVTKLKDEPFAREIATLDKSLYSHDAESWQAENLLQAFEAYRKTSVKRGGKNRTAALTPLRLNKTRTAAK